MFIDGVDALGPFGRIKVYRQPACRQDPYVRDTQWVCEKALTSQDALHYKGFQQLLIGARRRDRRA
ncbi:hypothetical protein BST24_08010 [Mycobacteroides franklinii]|nr:hypothetical protein BST24_08010 [Mycobacteroides franklinii]